MKSAGALSKIVLLAAVMGLAPMAVAQAPSKPAVQPATDGILAAFKTRPLVGMSDRHGIAQQQDFYAALVRDPRFAREVGNVVVEFGSASHQALIDRYVAGEDVPYTELRKVWSDVVGWNPTVTFVGFVNVFASIRGANAGLPPDQRIKVWLGEPPVDWATATKADVSAAMSKRDSYPANLIVENILKKNRKALVIYGGAHLTSDAPAKPRTAPSPGAEAALRKIITDTAKGAPDYAIMTPEFADRVRQGFAAAQADLAPRGAILSVAFKAGDEATSRDVFLVTFAKGDPQTIAVGLDAQGRVTGFGKQSLTLRDGVEERYPNSFFIVWPHSGNGQNRCTEAFESNLRDWPTPALATSVRGSSLEPELRKPDCHIGGADPLWFDGFLYLGPVATLLQAPRLTDLYLDPAYRAEISRRQPLRGFAALPPATNNYSVTPAPWTPTAATGAAPTPAEADRMAAFKANDKDNDGKLDKAAYRTLLETLGFADQLERLFAQRDVNKDGFVSAEEYRTPIQ